MIPKGALKLKAIVQQGFEDLEEAAVMMFHLSLSVFIIYLCIYFLFFKVADGIA